MRLRGFVVIDGPFDKAQTLAVARGYDDAFASLPEAEIKRGRTSVRFGGLAALEPFCRIYLHALLLQLAREHIGGPFQLSSFHARTLGPHTAASPLHQDVQRGSDGAPQAGFIFMVDDFRAENGATRFVPRSQHLSHSPGEALEQQACGPAGSIIVFDGATWHEHGANRTDVPRRSIQGCFVRQDHAPAVRWRKELSREEVRSLPPDARRLLGCDTAW